MWKWLLIGSLIGFVVGFGSIVGFFLWLGLQFGTRRSIQADWQSNMSTFNAMDKDGE